VLEILFDNPIIDRQWPMSMSEAEIAQVGVGFMGDQRIYRFPNGYGASLVQMYMIHTNGKGEVYSGIHPVTEELLWEIGVVRFNSNDDTDFTLTFETSVADDVIKYVTASKAELILRKIKELPFVQTT